MPQHAPGTGSLGPTAATEHIKALLNKAGIPLEMRAAHACQAFAKRRQRAHRVSTTASRLVYGPLDEGQSLREIDQLVTLYGEAKLSGGQFGLAVKLMAPIECKHRTGAAYFGIEHPRGARRLAAFPVSSDLSGSRLIDRCIQPGPSAIQALPDTTVVGVEFGPGGEARRMLEENVTYKATGALYDFIKSHCTPLDDLLIDGFTKTGLRRRLRLTDEMRLPWQRWLTEFRTADAQLLTKHVTKPGHLMLDATHYIPIICVDAPLYLTRVQKDGTVDDPAPVELLSTVARLPKWPGKLRLSIAYPAPEARAIVCNVESLPNLLDILADWHGRMLARLRAAHFAYVKSAMLEACVRRLAVESLDKEWHSTTYNSDYDFLLDLD